MTSRRARRSSGVRVLASVLIVGFALAIVGCTGSSGGSGGSIAEPTLEERIVGTWVTDHPDESVQRPMVLEIRESGSFDLQPGVCTDQTGRWKLRNDGRVQFEGTKGLTVDCVETHWTDRFQFARFDVRFDGDRMILSDEDEQVGNFTGVEYDWMASRIIGKWQTWADGADDGRERLITWNFNEDGTFDQTGSCGPPNGEWSIKGGRRISFETDQNIAYDCDGGHWTNILPSTAKFIGYEGGNLAIFDSSGDRLGVMNPRPSR